MSTFGIKTNDLLPSLEVTLKDGRGTAVDLTTASSVRFIMRLVGSSTPKVSRLATIVTPALGFVRHDWQAGDTDTAGDYRAEWEVTFPGQKPMTFPSEAYDTVKVGRDLG